MSEGSSSEGDEADEDSGGMDGVQGINLGGGAGAEHTAGLQSQQGDEQGTCSVVTCCLAPGHAGALRSGL